MFGQNQQPALIIIPEAMTFSSTQSALIPFFSCGAAILQEKTPIPSQQFAASPSNDSGDVQDGFSAQRNHTRACRTPRLTPLHRESGHTPAGRTISLRGCRLLPKLVGISPSKDMPGLAPNPSL